MDRAGPAAERGSRSREYAVCLARDAAEWSELLGAVQHPHLPQTWTYGDARACAGGVSRIAQGLSVRRLVFTRDAVPVAICQVIDKVVARWCLASRIHRGPLLLDTVGSQPGEVAAGVYGALRALWRHPAHGILFLSPALEACPASESTLRRAGFRPRDAAGWCSMVLDLRRSDEELSEHLAPTWRNRLRRAEACGLEVHVSDSTDSLEWLLRRHDENREAKRFEEPTPRFVAALCAATAGDWFICEACCPDEREPVGAMLVVRYGDWAEYFVGWFGDAGRRAGAGNFLYWNCVLEARRRGALMFDLGGYSVNERFGVRHFKQGMRGMEYRLVHEWLALPSLGRSWRYVPVEGR